MLGAYDVDAKLLDAMGNEVGSPLTAVLTTLPATGSLTFDGTTGEFTYVPVVNTTGDYTFTYRLFDGIDLSRPIDGEDRDAVYGAFLDHHLIIIRGQALNAEQLTAAARIAAVRRVLPNPATALP